MSRETKKIWTTLVQAGLVHGPIPETGKLEAPWYVKVLLAFSAWFAAFFILSFVSLAFGFIMKNNSASLITGVLMMGSAFAILRKPGKAFEEHLALAMSVAGQVIAMWALFNLSKNSDFIFWALVTALQASLAILMPNVLHRVLSSFSAALAFSLALTALRVPDVFSSMVLLLASWLWLNEFRYPEHLKKIQAIAYGLVLALIPLKGTALFGNGTMGILSARNTPELLLPPWMGEVLASGVMLYVVWQLLLRHHQDNGKRLAITALLSTIIFCAVSIEAPGILIGMVILLLGFECGNRILLSLGIVSLLFYISSYYYLLDASLLAKSKTLFIVSLVLFAGRWVLLRIFQEEMNDKYV